MTASVGKWRQEHQQRKVTLGRQFWSSRSSLPRQFEVIMRPYVKETRRIKKGEMNDQKRCLAKGHPGLHGKTLFQKQKSFSSRVIGKRSVNKPCLSRRRRDPGKRDGYREYL